MPERRATVAVEDWDMTDWPPPAPDDSTQLVRPQGIPWRRSRVLLIADDVDTNEREA